MANPWIADAAVLKLYPDRLQIAITERQAFALWQKDGRVGVIAADGTVLEPFIEAAYRNLPLVVGTRRRTRRPRIFSRMLDRYPEIRDSVRASILVAERRWNLRLEERPRRAAAGSRRRAGARAAGRARPRKEASVARHHVASICGCPTA